MRKEFTHQLASTYKPKTAKEVQDKGWACALYLWAALDIATACGKM